MWHKRATAMSDERGWENVLNRVKVSHKPCSSYQVLGFMHTKYATRQNFDDDLNALTMTSNARKKMTTA